MKIILSKNSGTFRPYKMLAVLGNGPGHPGQADGRRAEARGQERAEERHSVGHNKIGEESRFSGAQPGGAHTNPGGFQAHHDTEAVADFQF